MKRTLFLTSIIMLLVAGCSIFDRDAKPAPEPQQQTSVPTVNQAPDSAAVTPHPLSIEAYAQKEFNGRDLRLGRVLEKNEAYTRYFITYTSGDLTISGIMNVPAGEGPFPVLVLNHGYIDPAVYTNGRGLRREQDYLARRGYVVVHPDYRNHAESDKTTSADLSFRFAYVEDVINAVMAIKNSDLTFLDKEKIGMLGHSMGGGIALAAMVMKPDLVDAYVLFAPVSADVQDNFNRWIKNRPDVANQIEKLFGTAETNPEFWRNISPINFVERIAAPVMIHHGTADDSVPLSWSERLTSVATEAGEDVTLYTYPGQPHEFTTAWPQVMQRTVDFFDQHVK